MSDDVGKSMISCGCLIALFGLFLMICGPIIVIVVGLALAAASTPSP